MNDDGSRPSEQPAGREQRIAEIIAEFGDIFAFARTRWTRYAEEVHEELRGIGLMILQIVMRKGPISATEVGQLLDMDKAMVSRHVAKLRCLELLETEASAEDRRVQLLSVSARGGELLDRLHERSAEAYRERFDGWSVDELARLRDGLHRFNSAAE